ncbi:helix-turn-helix domain-containing protein [Bradyrhizobium sp.]|uniref:helix-turn-helix domain-containing protein n=1 Tax=Bradyrhizobium sp. TaxID=376 RepID=UPI003C79624F
MSRVTQNPVVYLALSPSAVATALGIRADEVANAINDGLLPVFVMGIKRRVLCSDIERWVRSWPKAVAKKRTVPNG